MSNSIVVPNASELVLLQYLLGIAAPGDFKLRVFSNDVTPDEDTVLSDLTEVVDTSYAAITLAHGTWTVSSVSGVAVGEYPQQTFTFSSTHDLYGYYVTDSAGTSLLWVQRGPYIAKLPAGGGTYLVTPRFRISQGS